jgi:predicted ATP-dependent endonuclease of OLD family
MKLKKVTISGFRSIKKTETLLVEDRVTILIGANDHGKTNILNATEFLNEEKAFDENDVNWDLETGAEVFVEWHFTPSAAVLEKLATFEPVIEEAQPEGTPEKPLIEINTDNEIVYYRKRGENKVRVKSVPTKVLLTKEADVLLLRPRIELFAPPTTNLKDQVNLAELETPNFEFMQGIFRLAGIWDVRKDIFIQNDKTSKLLDEASKKLTNVLNTKWNQGRDLKWKLEHTGNNGDHIVIKIQDPAIDSRYTRPSLRSSGFRTYFLLSMITYARTENKTADSYVYLFDEPGTYLHPHAQLDLQRSFEVISNRTQIVYTTHSLFLINKNYPGRNRVISKAKDGTKIDQKPFVKNWKSVRESLGILLSNNFLIAEKSLLVEGPSDVIYILHAIKKLKNGGEIDIDLNDLSVVDAGTSENYLAMAKLMIAEGREVVALLDGDKKGDEIEKQLKKVCDKEIRDKKLQILKLPRDTSIEDMFTDANVIKKAIEGVANDLTSLGIRKFKKDLVLNDELAKIVITTGTTFGKVIEEKTTALFDPAEKLSKLSIALKYEDIISDSVALPEQAKEQIEAIKEKLALKDEKNEGKTIFVEV